MGTRDFHEEQHIKEELNKNGQQLDFNVMFSKCISLNVIIYILYATKVLININMIGIVEEILDCV